MITAANKEWLIPSQFTIDEYFRSRNEEATSRADSPHSLQISSARTNPVPPELGKELFGGSEAHITICTRQSHVSRKMVESYVLITSPEGAQWWRVRQMRIETLPKDRLRH